MAAAPPIPLLHLEFSSKSPPIDDGQLCSTASASPGVMEQPANAPLTEALAASKRQPTPPPSPTTAPLVTSLAPPSSRLPQLLPPLPVELWARILHDFPPAAFRPLAAASRQLRAAASAVMALRLRTLSETVLRAVEAAATSNDGSHSRALLLGVARMAAWAAAAHAAVAGLSSSEEELACAGAVLEAALDQLLGLLLSTASLSPSTAAGFGVLVALDACLSRVKTARATAATTVPTPPPSASPGCKPWWATSLRVDGLLNAWLSALAAIVDDVGDDNDAVVEINHTSRQQPFLSFIAACLGHHPASWSAAAAAVIKVATSTASIPSETRRRRVCDHVSRLQALLERFKPQGITTTAAWDDLPGAAPATATITTAAADRNALLLEWRCALRPGAVAPRASRMRALARRLAAADAAGVGDGDHDSTKSDCADDGDALASGLVLAAAAAVALELAESAGSGPRPFDALRAVFAAAGSPDGSRLPADTVARTVRAALRRLPGAGGDAAAVVLADAVRAAPRAWVPVLRDELWRRFASGGGGSARTRLVPALVALRGRCLDDGDGDNADDDEDDDGDDGAVRAALAVATLDELAAPPSLRMHVAVLLLSPLAAAAATTAAASFAAAHASALSRLLTFALGLEAATSSSETRRLARRAARLTATLLQRGEAAAGGGFGGVVAPGSAAAAAVGAVRAARRRPVDERLRVTRAAAVVLSHGERGGGVCRSGDDDALGFVAAACCEAADEAAAEAVAAAAADDTPAGAALRHAGPALAVLAEAARGAVCGAATVAAVVRSATRVAAALATAGDNSDSDGGGGCGCGSGSDGDECDCVEANNDDVDDDYWQRQRRHERGALGEVAAHAGEGEIRFWAAAVSEAAAEAAKTTPSTATK
ncbi:hypothetical protein HK405_010766 [Cladochytrium tenue]|nr:hypothetical protein HK405_010766 [Cladochytrium tenue]